MTYQCRVESKECNGIKDTLIILESPGNEDRVAISTLAASIEDLVLTNQSGSRDRLVFGHLDVVAGKKIAMQDYSSFDLHSKDVVLSRRNFLMRGGVPVTHFPGRLFGGQMFFLQADGSYQKFALPVSHPQFGSLLHFGDGKNLEYDVRITNQSEDSAEVLFRGVLGKCFPGFPGEVISEVIYELKDHQLKRTRKIYNHTPFYITIPTSDHGSYMPGIGSTKDLMLSMRSTGVFELDPKTKVATGRRKQDQEYLENERVEEGNLEEMFEMNGSIIDIYNIRESIGLRINADTRSRIAYVWKPNTPPIKDCFISVQPYDNIPTAALSLPAFSETFTGIDKSFLQTPGFLIPSFGSELVSKQSFQAI